MDIFRKASELADQHIQEQKESIVYGAQQGVEAGQDARCMKDFFEFTRTTDDATIATRICRFIDNHLFDEESVTILATLVLYADEDGEADEYERGVATMLERIERSNKLMARWEQMIETQLVYGTPGHGLAVDPTRLTHYIRAMGFTNVWSDEYDREDVR